MKLRAFIKLALKQLVRDFHTFILVFALFPIVLGGLMGYFQRDIFTPEAKDYKFSLNLKDDDNTVQSRAYRAFIESEQIKDIIEIKEEGTKIEVVIPKGFENRILSGNDSKIIIKEKEAGNKEEMSLISQITDKYLAEISEGLLLTEKVNTLNISEANKKELIEKINKEIAEAYNEPLYKTTIVKVKKSLSSYEHYSVTFLGFMFIMLIMSLVAGVFKEREDGIFNRIISTATTKTQYFNYSLISTLLFALVINLVYVAAYRLTGLSFKGSFELLAILIIAQSILGIAATGIVVAFFNKKTAMIFINILMMVQIIIGVLPNKILEGNFVLSSIGKLSPDVLLSKAYKNFIIYNDLKSIFPYIVAILGVSVIFYIISLAKVNIKWGEQR